MASQLKGDIHVEGSLTATTLGIPSGTVVNDDVAAAAAIAASKLQHQYEKVYSQESATSAADEARVAHVVQGATGTIEGFEAGSVVAAVGDDTCDVDLLKNGTTVLNAAITLDSTNVAYTVEAGTVGTSAVVDGDVLEIKIDATHNTGTLAKGIFACVKIREDADA